MPCLRCKQTGHNAKTRSFKKTTLVPLESYEPTLDSSYDTSDISLIRALATEILNAMGAGHTESVYHNAMKIGLQDYNLKFETERDIPLTFRGRYVGTVRADLIIENRLVIELKASSGTDAVVSDALEQCRIYMKETSIPSGIVVVFPKRVGGKLLVSLA